MSDIDILLHGPSKGIKQPNGFEVFFSRFASNFFICAGFVKGIQYMAHQGFKLFPGAGKKPNKLDVIRIGMPARINIEINKQIKIQKDFLGFLHQCHNLHQFAVSNCLHNDFTVNKIQVF